MSTATKTEAPARRVEFAAPPVDLHRDADGYTLEVEMPGVAKDGVEVTVEDGKLVLTGQRTNGKGFGSTVYRETTGGAYRRVFDLDPDIDAGKITARIEQGLLTVRLQKAEEVKPRRITVA